MKVRVHAAEEGGEARKSACFQGWNGWSWHWAQSIRTPRNARETRAARRSGSGRSSLGSKVTEMKLVAG